MIETKITAADGPAVRNSRRTHARDSLFLCARIRKPGQADSGLEDVRVRNLSAIGLMADYSEVAHPGDAVIVQMRGLGSVAGKVAWVKRGRIGITFDCQVDPLAARKPVGKKVAPPLQRPL